MDFFIIQNSDDTFLEPPPDSFLLLLLLPRLQWERDSSLIHTCGISSDKVHEQGRFSDSQPASCVFSHGSRTSRQTHSHTPQSWLLAAGESKGFPGNRILLVFPDLRGRGYWDAVRRDGICGNKCCNKLGPPEGKQRCLRGRWGGV